MNYPNNLKVGLNGYMDATPANAYPGMPAPGVTLPTMVRMPTPGSSAQVISQPPYQMVLDQAQQVQQQKVAANYYAQQRQQQHQAMAVAQAQSSETQGKQAQHLSSQQIQGMGQGKIQPTYMDVNMNGQAGPVMGMEHVITSQQAQNRVTAANFPYGPNGVYQSQIPQTGRPATQAVIVVDGNGQQRMMQMVMGRGGVPSHGRSEGSEAPSPQQPPPQAGQLPLQAMVQTTRPPAVSLVSGSPQSRRMSMAYQPSMRVLRQGEKPGMSSYFVTPADTPHTTPSLISAHQSSPMESATPITPSPAQIQHQVLSSMQGAGPIPTMSNASATVTMSADLAGFGQHSKSPGSMGPPSSPPAGARSGALSQTSPYGRMNAGTGLGAGVGSGRGMMRKRVLSTASMSNNIDAEAFQQENLSPGNLNINWNTPVMVAPGQGVLRLMQFCDVMRETELAQNLNFCKHMVASWFANQGKIIYVLRDKDQLHRRTFELPYATLPRWFHSNSLIRDRLTSSFTFMHAREERLSIGSSGSDFEQNQVNPRALVVTSDDARWTSSFANGTHNTSSGSVQVVMTLDPESGDLRINTIIFSLDLHEEWISRTAWQKGVSGDQTADGTIMDLDDVSTRAAGLCTSSPALSMTNIKGEATPMTDTTSLPSATSSKGSMKFPKTKSLTKKQQRENAKRDKAEAAAREAEEESVPYELRMEAETGQVDLMSSSMRRDGTTDKASSQGMASRQFSLDGGWSLPESRVNQYGMTFEAMRYLELVQGTLQLRDLFGICASEKVGPRDALRRAAAQARLQLSENPVDRSGNDSVIGYHQDLRAMPMQSEAATLWQPSSAYTQTDLAKADCGEAMTPIARNHHPIYHTSPGNLQTPGISNHVTPPIPPPSPIRMAAAHAVSDTLKRKFAASSGSNENQDSESPLEGQMSVTIRQTVSASPHKR